MNVFTRNFRHLIALWLNGELEEKTAHGDIFLSKNAVLRFNFARTGDRSNRCFERTPSHRK